MPDSHTDNKLLMAFVQGAKWWEWHKTGATMWQSDQRIAWDKAEERLKKGSLGRDSLDVLRDRLDGKS